MGETVVRNNCVKLDSRGGRRVASIWRSPTERCADRATSRAGTVFDVTIEASLSAIDPVRGIVAVNPRPCTHEAEKNVTGWSDHNSDMPAPHDQVAGLRVRDPLKPLDSIIEIVGTGVGIGKARALVNGMYQVRTVVP